MEDMDAAPDGLDRPLPPEAQARLDRFKALTIRHPSLDQVERELRQVIWEPAGFAYVLLYGPSGVGKSTLLAHLAARLNQARQVEQRGDPSSVAAILLQTRPPDGKLFHRNDYYATGLRGLGHTSLERRIRVDLTNESHFERKEPRRATRYQDTPELRDAWEAALRDHQVRAVFLDEAQHLLKNSTCRWFCAHNGSGLLNQSLSAFYPSGPVGASLAARRVCRLHTRSQRAGSTPRCI
jgi:energy-coupling factor transporter ATP-binding protein EcfA2